MAADRCEQSRSQRRQRLGSWAVLAALTTGCTVTEAGVAPPPSTVRGRAEADVTGSGLGSDSTQGVTDSSVTISMLAVDLQFLVDQGLAPSIGNPVDTARATVADINTHGGINGRELVLKPHLLDPSSALVNPSSGQRFCIDATEGDEPVASIEAAALPSELVRCVAVAVAPS